MMRTHLRPTVSARAPLLASNAAMGWAAQRKPTVPDLVQRPWASLVSALIRGRLPRRLSLDRLARFLVLLGSDVEIVAKPRPRTAGRDRGMLASGPPGSAPRAHYVRLPRLSCGSSGSGGS